MPGLPSYRQSQFPNEKPPTLFSPASPKDKASKSAKVMDDGASTMTTSSFSSTVGLIKSKLPSYKDHKERKSSESEKKYRRIQSHVSLRDKWIGMVSAPDGGFRELKADEWIYSQGRTAEAYMYVSMNK
ncbi:hypothetical protein LCER1_G002298 [Lachnellula cervina]|uniref:Uncharacterized protein n=1 Tax=Lachnellula cervina TaxID=1316786 RepID=A0A7D8USA2_9HELO|nr:hypothetical protein LCER1_G002298 [Lachnellula cervina]